MSARRLILAGNNTAAQLVLDTALEALPPADVLCLGPHGGRHHDWQPSLVAHARRRGVGYLEPEDVNAPDVVEAIAAFGPALLLSVYYTQLFRGELLAAVGGPAVNVHPSLLPRHRGVAPLVWAIVEGDDNAGVTVHHIDRRVDTGHVIWQRPLPIHPTDTGYELHVKAANLVQAGCAWLLRGWLADGTLPDGVEQRGRATHHSRRDPQVNHLDFAQGQRRVRDVVRALAPPLPGAYCFTPSGERLVLAQVTPVAGDLDGLQRPPGYVEMLLGGTATVWTSDGPLRIDGFVHHGELRRGAALGELLGLAEGDLLA